MHYQRARYRGVLPPPPPTRTCAHCGERFESSRWTTEYCSHRCNAAARYQRDRRKPQRFTACAECGTTLDGRRTDTRFCSEKCGSDWRNRRTAERTLRAKESRPPCEMCGGPIPARKHANAVYCSVACKIRSRRHKTYGLTADELALLLAQHEVCAICRTDQWSRKGPQVDHDHATGQVRGVLCKNCNTGLGQFKDDPVRLLAAVEYLGVMAYAL